MDLELIPKSRDIFRMERRGFRTIRFLISPSVSRILTLRGRPLRALSFKLPVSLYLWIVDILAFYPRSHSEEQNLACRLL